MEIEENIEVEDRLIRLQNLVRTENAEGLVAFLSQQSEYEIALALQSFPNADKTWIWQYVPADLKGGVLAKLSEETRDVIVSEMEVHQVSEITKDLDAQDIAEILESVEPEFHEQLIEQLDENTQNQVKVLQSYDDDCVGRYMTPTTVNIKDTVTLETIQRFIRIKSLLDERSQEVFVTNADNQLVGTLSLIDLIKQPQETLVSEFLHVPVSLLDTCDIRDAANILRAKELKFAPVVNSQNQLVGQLTSEDILDIIQEDSDTTMLNLSRVSDDQELFAPILFSAKSRGIWLGINLATAFLAAYVIGQFEAVLSQVVALAILMPVVASMGGIAGSQTLTLVIRGMAMGQVGGDNKIWLFQKELWVGAINGTVWALVVVLVAQIWFQDAKISLIIGLAIVINMVVANLSGISIPLMLKRMGIDPALSGAVILTTVTDVVGFMSFLGLATLLLI